MTTATTDTIVQALRDDASQSIAPCTYTWAYGRRFVPAAFRKALALGIIEVAYISVVGTPCYRRVEA